MLRRAGISCCISRVWNTVSLFLWSKYCNRRLTAARKWILVATDHKQSEINTSFPLGRQTIHKHSASRGSAQLTNVNEHTMPICRPAACSLFWISSALWLAMGLPSPVTLTRCSRTVTRNGTLPPAPMARCELNELQIPICSGVSTFFWKKLWRETLNCPDPCRKGSNLREAELHFNHTETAFAPVWDPSPSYPTFLVCALPLTAPFCYLAQYFTVLMHPKSF